MSEAGDRRAVEAIVEMVETYFGLPANSLLEHNRAAPLVEPRQIAMYLLRVELGLRLTRIAANLDRDHTTVYHGATTVKRSGDLWYLRAVVRGDEVFCPKNPSIEYLTQRVASYYQIPTRLVRRPDHRKAPGRARQAALLVADNFDMAEIARTYLNIRSQMDQERICERPFNPFIIETLTNQVRRHHGTQQEHWAVSGRRYHLVRSPQERGSPVPARE